MAQIGKISEVFKGWEIVDYNTWRREFQKAHGVFTTRYKIPNTVDKINVTQIK